MDHYANARSRVERIGFAAGQDWSRGLLVGSGGSDTLTGTAADETHYGDGGAGATGSARTSAAP